MTENDKMLIKLDGYFYSYSMRRVQALYRNRFNSGLPDTGEVAIPLSRDNEISPRYIIFVKLDEKSKKPNAQKTNSV